MSGRPRTRTTEDSAQGASTSSRYVAAHYNVQCDAWVVEVVCSSSAAEHHTHKSPGDAGPHSRMETQASKASWAQLL